MRDDRRPSLRSGFDPVPTFIAVSGMLELNWNHTTNRYDVIVFAVPITAGARNIVAATAIVRLRACRTGDISKY